MPKRRRHREEADQAASEADQTAADSDQTASDTDQTASDRDQELSEADQRSSDRDQAAADREEAHHSPDQKWQRRFEAGRRERGEATIDRHATRIARAQVASERD